MKHCNIFFFSTNFYLFNQDSYTTGKPEIVEENDKYSKNHYKKGNCTFFFFKPGKSREREEGGGVELYAIMYQDYLDFLVPSAKKF